MLIQLLNKLNALLVNEGRFIFHTSFSVSHVLLYLVGFFPFTRISFGLSQLENEVKKSFSCGISPLSSFLPSVLLISSWCKIAVLPATGSFLFALETALPVWLWCDGEPYRILSAPPNSVTTPLPHQLLTGALDRISSALQASLPHV